MFLVAQRNFKLHLIALCVFALASAPFIVKQAAWAEWQNSYYFLIHQANNVKSGGFPSFFVSSPETGILYPNHLFYSGLTTGLMSYLALVVPPWFVYVATIVLAYWIFYLGVFHLSQSIQNRPLFSSVIAMTTGLSPFMLTEVYGRGAWSELLGVSLSIFLLGLIAKNRRIESTLHRSSALLIVVVAFFLTTTHNISLLLFVFFAMPVVALVHFIGHEESSRVVRIHDGQIIRNVALGIGLASWWLVPNLWYGRSTDIASWRIGATADPLIRLRVVLWPSLLYPSEQNDITRSVFGKAVNVRFFNQTMSVLLFVCVGLVIMLLSYARVDKQSKSRLLIAMVVTFVAIWLIVNPSAWSSKYFPFTAVQFSYRCMPYLAVFIALLATYVYSVAVRFKWRRGVTVLFVAAITWNFALAIFQVGTAVAVSPPGFTNPSRNTIERGISPPLFSGQTAAPVQFRFSNLGANIDSPAGILNLKPSGRPQAVVTIDLTITSQLLSPDASRRTPLFTVGRDLRADSISATQSNGLLTIYVDRWGQPLLTSVVDMSSIDSFKFSAELNWALGKAVIKVQNQIVLVVSGMESQEFDNIYIGANPIGFSNVITTATSFLISKSITINDQEVPQGWYKTNAVWSPFTQSVGTLRSGRSGDGFWVVQINNPKEFRVNFYPTLPFYIGKIISIFCLSLIIFSRRLHRLRIVALQRKRLKYQMADGTDSQIV